MSQRTAALLQVLFVCLFLLQPSCRESAESPGTTTPEESFDAIFPDLMAKWGVPGGAVAVVRDGRLVFAKGYGLAEKESGAPATPSSLFRVASLSKPLTAAAVLRLRAQGLLGLEDRVFRTHLVPTPPPGTSMDPRLLDVTVRHLLEHAGGWDRSASFDPMFLSTEISASLGKPGPASASDVVRYMTGRRLDFAPGARYAYSNFGYCLLGRVIEKVTGKGYAAAMKELVLDPAGIPSMRLGRTRPSGRADGEVRYYDYAGAPLAPSVFPDDEEPVPWPYGGFHLEAMDAHGAWLASVTDLMRFIIACDGRSGGVDILDAESIAVQTARPDLPDWASATSYYGLGWQVRPTGNDANWWHTGSLPGTASILVRAANGLAWAGLFNSRPADADGFFNELDHKFWEAVEVVTEWPATDLFSPSAAGAKTAGLSGASRAPGMRAGAGSAAGTESPRRSGERSGGGEAGRTASILAGVIVSSERSRSLAVISGAPDDARALRIGALLEGARVLEISDKGMTLERGGRSVFVPLGGEVR